MKELTVRQARILNYIRIYIRDNGKSPTLKEIGSVYDLEVRATVCHLEALEKKGRLYRVPGWRGIRLL